MELTNLDRKAVYNGIKNYINTKNCNDNLEFLEELSNIVTPKLLKYHTSKGIKLVMVTFCQSLQEINEQVDKAKYFSELEAEQIILNLKNSFDNLEITVLA
jgi:hypothetical protein